MAGIFDFLGGGGPAPTPGLLDAAGYMDPKQYDAARRSQGMMGLWAGLLQGGGPSLDPRNFGSALGAGIGGMSKFGSQFDEDQLHAAQAAAQRATVQKSAAEIDIKKQGYQLAQDWLNKGEAPPGAAPVGGAGAVPNFGDVNTGRGGGGWGPHANTAIETLKAAGYSDAAIQGIMANGLGEGGFKTNWQKAWGDENSFGHWQFYEKGELPGYRAFVKEQGGDERDTRLQALYVAKRAEEVHPGFGKLTDPKLATDIFATKFERYKGAAPGQRYGLLADATRYMAGTPVEERAPIPAGPGGYTGPAPSGALPAFAEGRAGAFGGPVPAVVAGGPAAPAPAPLAGAPSGNRPGANLPATGAGLVTPQDYAQWLASQRAPGNNIKIEPLSGEAAPAGAGPTYGSGVLRGPVPAAMAAPAPAAPAPPPAAGPPGAMPVPMPAAPAAPAAAPGAAPAPGPMTVTLPAPPPIPAPVAIPPAQPLPAAPATPAIPPRPQIPGVAPGAAVSPAVASRARQAQGVVLGLSMMGVHVPSFLEKEAGIEIAGRTAAAEAEARQPIELQNKTFEASLTAAQKRWDALTDQQKETLAFQRGLTKDQMNEMYKNIHEQYKSVLDLTTAGPKAQAIEEGQEPSKIRLETHKTDEQIRKEKETPREIKILGEDGESYTRWMSPNQLEAERNARAGLAPGAAAPGAPGAAPLPGVLSAQSPRLEEVQKGLGRSQIKTVDEINDKGSAALASRPDTEFLLRGGKLDWQGPLSPGKQAFNRLTSSVLGWNSEYVKDYEQAQYLMGQRVRAALRASDPNPTGKQQEMLNASFPTPETSEKGYKAELKYMQGIEDWQIYRKAALKDHMNNNRNDPNGFDDTVSAIPFVFLRMSEPDKDAYMARLARTDPNAARNLIAQADMLRQRNWHR